MSDLLRGVSLYLIGMMGAGKSTLGKRLAQRLGYRCIDTDVLIEQIAGKPISQIFAESGEESFRSLETQVLAELSAYTRTVLSTGGGIILQQENWSYLRHGLVVWLDVPVEQLVLRLQTDTTRPLLRQPDLATMLSALLEQRQPLYRQADLHLVCHGRESPEQLVERLLEQIQVVIKPEADPLAPEN